jgi:hypothetical protein
MKYFMASLVLGVILTVIGNLFIDPNDINAVALYVGFSIIACLVYAFKELIYENKRSITK